MRVAARGLAAAGSSAHDDAPPSAPVVARRPGGADSEGGKLEREEGGAGRGRPCQWHRASPSLEAIIWRAFLQSQGLGIVGTTPATRGRLSSYQPLRKSGTGRSRLKPDIPPRKISGFAGFPFFNTAS